MKNYSVFLLTLILTPFVFSYAFGLDIYIPIIPQMTQIFHTTPALVHLTLSLFLFVTGAGQLLIGPLSDQFGRRAIFYYSSACYALGSLGCAFSSHIAWLIAARVISSFGACGMLVTSLAVVRDLFSNEKSAKMYSFLNGAIGISPTFAPIIGGWLAVNLGWQSVFLFLTLIGFFSLFITKQFIRETHEKENRIKINRQIFKRYKQVFTHRQFIIYSTIAGCSEAVFFCFFSISPFIIIDLLSVPTHHFGYYFASFGFVIALGGMLGGKIIGKIGVQPTIGIGIFLMLLGGLSMLAWYYLGSLTLPSFLVPMMIACMGAMFVAGGSASAALEPFGSIAGTASAAFGSLQLGMAALVGSILMNFPVTSTVSYGISIVLMATFASSLFFIRDRIPDDAAEN